MTADDVRAWLRRGWKINREIDALKLAVDEARARAMSTTVNYNGVVVSGSADGHGFDRLAALEDDVRERVEELCGIQREILRVVRRVRDGSCRTLLILRYVDFRTWEQIAVVMDYSWRQVHRIHDAALLAVAALLEKKA